METSHVSRFKAITGSNASTFANMSKRQHEMLARIAGSTTLSQSARMSHRRKLTLTCNLICMMQMQKKLRGEKAPVKWNQLPQELAQHVAMMYLWPIQILRRGLTTMFHFGEEKKCGHEFPPTCPPKGSAEIHTRTPTGLRALKYRLVMCTNCGHRLREPRWKAQGKARNKIGRGGRWMSALAQTDSSWHS